MKLVLATPLYPPDIAEPAPYIKELARRLAQEHEVTVVAYGHLPEAIEGVRIISVDKRHPLLFRLVAYMLVLGRTALRADIVYVENGASVELPASIVSFLVRARMIFHIGDAAAHRRAAESGVHGALERFARARADVTIMDAPAPRPEILPFVPAPVEALAAYERSWNAHLQELTGAFAHE
jgi:hypothetical protein